MRLAESPQIQHEHMNGPLTTKLNSDVAVWLSSMIIHDRYNTSSHAVDVPVLSFL